MLIKQFAIMLIKQLAIMLIKQLAIVLIKQLATKLIKQTGAQRSHVISVLPTCRNHSVLLHIALAEEVQFLWALCINVY